MGVRKLVQPLCFLFVVVAICIPGSAQESGAPEPLPTQAMETQPAADRFTIRLQQGQEFNGYLGDKAAITMVIADTKVEIPVYKIKSLKLDNSRSGKAAVQLRDGDSLIAQLVPAIIDLSAEWGEVSINTDALSSMQLSTDS